VNIIRSGHKSPIPWLKDRCSYIEINARADSALLTVTGVLVD